MPGLPKHAMTAFMFFRCDVHNQMKKDQIDMKLVEISRVASKLWGEASAETRKPFLEQAVTD